MKNKNFILLVNKDCLRRKVRVRKEGEKGKEQVSLGENSRLTFRKV